MRSRDLSLVPMPDDASVLALKESYTAMLGDAHRTFQPLSKPDTSFPANPGSPGWENNHDTVGGNLNAWWLFGDRVALESAFNVGRWLISASSLWDRAHSHRNKWFGALALAAREVGLGEGEFQRFMGGFKAWYSYLAADKYVAGNFSGITLRPGIRAMGEAVVVGKFAAKLVEGGALPEDFHATKPIDLINRALASLEAWCLRAWNPAAGKTWGWQLAPGAWNRKDHGWAFFPFLDGRDKIAMAKSTTWFHAGSIAETEFAQIKAVAPTRFAEHPAAVRAREMGEHALLFGFDRATGLSLKSIGYKVGASNVGCYAPGFATMPFSEQPVDVREDIGEPGYHDVTPALLFMADGGAAPENVKRIARSWLLRGARIVTPGEVPFGCLEMARRFYPASIASTVVSGFHGDDDFPDPTIPNVG